MSGPGGFLQFWGGSSNFSGGVPPIFRRGVPPIFRGESVIQVPPQDSRLRNTVNDRPVHILLECILVCQLIGSIEQHEVWHH